MHNFLSIWTLTADKSAVCPIAHELLLKKLEVQGPSRSGQDILNQLWAEGLLEIDTHGKYLLSSLGLGLRKLIPEGLVEKELSKEKSNPWGRFRKLLGYYMDCAYVQEKQSEYLFPDQEHKQFFIPILPYNWLPGLGKEPSEITITTRQRDAAAHNRIITRQEDDEEIYIGYPISTFRSKSNKKLLISPIALTPVDLKDFSETTLTLSLRHEECELNQKWFEYQIPQQEQRSFRRRLYSLAEKEHKGLFDLRRALPILYSQCDCPEGALDPNHLELVLPLKEEQRLVNVPILFVGSSLKYSKMMRKELMHISHASDAELDQTALAYIFRENPLTDQVLNEEILPLPFIDSNAEQRIAVTNALNKPISKVTGPPGTGKSQVAVNIIANLVYRGKSVLFTSKNHKAVHAIAERSDGVLGLGDSLPLVNFCSDPDGKTKNPWYKTDLETTIAQVQYLQRGQNEVAPHRVEISEREWLDNENYLSGRAELLHKLSESNHKIDLSQEIICSRLHLSSNHPLQDFFYTQIHSISKRISAKPQSEITWRHPLQLLQWLLWGKKKQAEALGELARHLPELHRRYHDPQQIRMTLTTCLEEWRNLRDEISSREKLEDQARKLCSEGDIVPIVRKILADLKQNLQPAFQCKRIQTLLQMEEDRKLREFCSGIMRKIQEDRSPSFLEHCTQEKFAQVDGGTRQFLKYYPAWAVTLLSLPSASPCLPGVFDTVIIDEASQCDIPPIIPALYRAKRAVIIGDPNQFPPVITLSDTRHDYLKNTKHHLTAFSEQCFDYMVNTAFSCVNTIPVMLREHFRCQEEIAEYCNQEYYNEQLVVRTSQERLHFPKNMGYRPGVEWIDVKDSPEEEIQQAVQHVKKLKDNGYKGTIGVISPFRRMAENLRSALYGLLTDEDINTVNGFQGGERDVILFVLGYTSRLNKGLNWYAEANENRYIYNVAVSRARACLLIIGDKERCKKSSCVPLRKLADLPFHKDNPNPDAPHFDSIWEERLYYALQQKGITPKTQYPLLGRRLDLAVISGDFKLDIEVDGVKYHTNTYGERNLDDVFRDLQVESAGWHVQRFWVYELRQNMEECVNKILTRIGKS